MKDSTAIIIALIGIIVPATGAYLAFYDKRHPIGEATATGIAATRGSATADPSTAPTGDTLPRDDTSAVTTAAVEHGATRQIAGMWRADDGYSFDFTQAGAQFRYHASQNGTDQGSGGGTISGDRLAYSFDSPDGPGACNAVLSGDGNAIAGRCHAADTPGKTWPIRIDRAVK